MMHTGEVAERLGVSLNTLRNWVDSGYIRCTIMPTGLRLFQEEDIEAFYQEYVKVVEANVPDKEAQREISEALNGGSQR